MMPRVQALASVVLALAAMSGVAACASILAIEETAFVELDGGADATTNEAPPTGSSVASPEAGARRGDGGDAGPAMCTLPSGRVCTSCLDTVCSSCPPGTTNLARLAYPETYSNLDVQSDATNLVDGRLVTSWIAAPYQTLPGEIRITLKDLATVTSVTVYSVRSELTHNVKDMDMQLLQGEHKLPPGTTAQKNGSGDIGWYPMDPLPEISQVIFQILSTTTQQPPGISEIEICGF